MVAAGGDICGVEVGVAAEAQEAGVVEAHDAVSGSALHGGDARLLIVKEDKLQAVDAGRAAPIALVGAHDGAVASDDRFQHKRSRAVEVDANVLGAALENDKFVVGQVIQKVRVRLAEGDADLILAGVFKGRVRDQAGECAFRIAMPLNGPEHVSDSDRAAVMPVGVFAQLQGIDQAVGAKLP